MGVLISIMFKLMFLAVHLMVMLSIAIVWMLVTVVCMCTRQRVPRMPRLRLPHIL